MCVHVHVYVKGGGVEFLILHDCIFQNDSVPYHDVQFYASWCEHSQRAEPEFLKAIQMLSDSNVTGMYIGKIDITKHGGKMSTIQVCTLSELWGEGGSRGEKILVVGGHFGGGGEDIFVYRCTCMTVKNNK